MDLVFQEVVCFMIKRRKEKKCYILENALNTDYLTIEPIVYDMLADINMRYMNPKRFMIEAKLINCEFQENVAIKKGEILDRDKDMFFNVLAKYGYSLTAHKHRWRMDNIWLICR